MKKIFTVILILSLALGVLGQTRRISTTQTQASQEQSVVAPTQKEPNYDPVITKLGKVIDIEDGFVYVKITTRYKDSGEGYYYFYACNIRAEATALLKFSKENYKDIYLMQIEEGACEKGDYVYLRFVPKAPLDVILPF
ncbi:MAG: hypothetical protein R3Y46_07110 [Opitutales bacterium]